MSESMIGQMEEFNELVAMGDEALERTGVMDPFGVMSWGATFTQEIQYCTPST